MKQSAQIILASASPRRRELLEQIGINALAVSVDIDETQKKDEGVLDYVLRLAQEKAITGYRKIDNPDDLPVLGSDTIVELAGVILGKPENREHAKQILQQLSGQKHKVHTAVAIVTKDDMFHAISSNEVLFKVLDEAEIDSYLKTGEADDKAGAYGIQGIAAQFVKNLNGSFSAVMGLPLFETVELLKRCGIDPLEENAG